ncbi:protein turtle homolog A-like isoform X2 [Rhinatrema bivittatum]|uniref:protein turtle homolog A-like isoform X2 n=1 Tax=Rhinatrema bivittatum TaxID=194408 RepID=UPI00112D0CD8|nr:protein turtle homolog A-like isoform X2 [Rhinatrema bivittatum]
MELVLLALLCGFLPVRSHADVMYSTLGQSILFPCERKSSQGSEPILWGFHRPGEDPPAHMTQNPGSLLTTSLSDKRSRVVVLSNSSLQLQGLQPEDAGIYTCIQRNPPTSQPLLNQVTLILLTVRILPRGPVGEGSHVLMRCSMTCDVDENRCTRNPQGAEVSWTDSHWQPIKEQAGRYSTQPGGTFSNLKVTVQQADHRRKWKCILSVNQQTQAVQEVAIPVRVVADASSPPQNGSIIALTCSVVYNPNSSDVFLAWADNRGIPLTPGTAGRFQVIQANSSLQLVIQDLQPSDAEGAWRCSLTAEGEERASQQYHLRFKGLHSGVAEGPRSGATILALLLLLLLLSVQCFLHTR